MSKEFKVGDRVRLRGSDTKGTVSRERHEKLTGYVVVNWDSALFEEDPSSIQHPECLIRLVKKFRREWVGGWNKAGRFHSDVVVFAPDQSPNNRPEVVLCTAAILREVKRK